MSEKLLVPDIGEFENVEVIEILLRANRTFYFPFGGPPRIRIWSLPVRSRAPYPIWPAVLII